MMFLLLLLTCFLALGLESLLLCSLVYDGPLLLAGPCVDLGLDGSHLTERFIVIHELATSLLVQTRLREGHDEQAPDDFEDVLERPLAGLPVSLQGVDTDLSGGGGDVRMENFGHEEALRGVLWEATLEQELTTEDSTVVGRPNYKTSLE